MDRIVRLLPLLLVLIIAMLTLAACGGEDDSGSTADDARSASTVTDVGEALEGVPVEVQATATLDLRIENAGAKDGAGLPLPANMRCTKSIPATCNTTIECPVADDAGDPDAQQVCGWLKSDGAAALADEEAGGRQVCTQIYGGPEVATVTGTLDGESIDATFSREDGCAIGRFDAAATLWLGVSAAGPVPAGGGGAAGACLALPPDTPVSSDAPATGGAADEVCATPPIEPDVIDDPPEAFDLEE